VPDTGADERAFASTLVARLDALSLRTVENSVADAGQLNGPSMPCELSYAPMRRRMAHIFYAT
jgi:hypothetical protein